MVMPLNNWPACLVREGLMDKRNLIVLVKCDLGKTYDVAAALADLPEAPTVYSTSGDYDIFTKDRGI
jgi:hypothetical protein